MANMKLLRIEYVDLSNNFCTLSDDSYRIDTVVDEDLNVIVGQYWLVDLDSGDLIVESPMEEMTVVNDGKQIRYVFGQEEEIDIVPSKQGQTDAGLQKDKLEDKYQVEQIMKKNRSFQSTHVLESGQKVNIQSKIVGRMLVQSCSDLDVVSVSPLTSKILEQMIHIEGPVEYDPDLGKVTFDNGQGTIINENEALQIFPDITVRASKTEKSNVVGYMASSYMHNTPVIEVGRHMGGYHVDPSKSDIIYPNMQFQIPDVWQGIVRYDIDPVSYDVFRKCVEEYLQNISDVEHARSCLNREFVNFNGVPITLSLQDRIALEQEYIEPHVDYSMEIVRPK